MTGPADLTYCSECEHRYVVNRGDPAFRWLCLMHKRADAVGFVDRAELTHPPYAACSRVNFGNCPLYEPARGPKDDTP